ncbi:hypothetical protein ACQR5U_02730 [Xanthomonas oryzae pv. oryzicola]|uniref:hypothetical protein n=1 Tax=Xanthomonas oryzae TaxID=347 RepID=UPI00117EA266|nr:hypothetical protein [Xanthomonas oryzae]
MKKTIKAILFLLGFFSACAYADGLRIYSGEQGGLAVIEMSQSYDVAGYGGAVKNREPVAGDCFFRAIVRKKKEPNYYEGDLLPVKNELVSFSEKDVAGKGAGMHLSPDVVKVTGVEVNDLCAYGIDFSGDYVLAVAGSSKYIEWFVDFVNLADQDAMKMNGAAKRQAAERLNSFMNAFDPAWKLDKQQEKVMARVKNDYGSLKSLIFAPSMSRMAASAHAVEPEKATLCANDEFNFFSCTATNGKIASLCGISKINPSSMSYKFGRPNKIELIYPGNSLAPEFLYSQYARAGTDYLQLGFNKSGYSYRIYREYNSSEDAAIKYGVAVTKLNGGGDNEMRLPCKTTTSDELIKAIKGARCDAGSALGCIKENKI